MFDLIQEYFEIILNRIKNPLPDGVYGEKHHIYPKSVGGSDLKANIVKLTPEEHYRCHAILPDIFLSMGKKEAYKKMLYAWHVIHTTHSGISVSEDEYGRLKREYQKLCSEHLKGNAYGSKNKGRTLSLEWRKKLSEARRGKKTPHSKPFTEEHRKHLSEALKGIKLSPETCRKMSESHKGKKHSAETKRRISEALRNRK